jgi:hypothetical protein
VLLNGLACRSNGQKIAIEKALNKRLAADATVVDFSTLTATLDWDRMYIFQPYSSKETICTVLQLSRDRCRSADIQDVDEGQFLLVFMQRNEIAHIEYIGRTVAEFEESDRCLAKAIRRTTATFNVERRDRPVLHCQL